MKLEDVPEEALTEEFVRFAAGPGGQHVNRTESAVRLHFRLSACPDLEDGFRARLCRLAGAAGDADEIVLTCAESRSLHRNRELAREKLGELLLRASAVPKKRRPTKPTKASRERRLASKAKHSQRKRERSGNYD